VLDSDANEVEATWILKVEKDGQVECSADVFYYIVEEPGVCDRRQGELTADTMDVLLPERDMINVVMDAAAYPCGG
jgi:hypothetical protein